jgi:hypothetical protein
MQRGSTRISYGDPRSQRTNGSGDHCPIQLVDQLQRSYRQSLFVEHDLGEPSGSTVDVVRRAGYPWPEQMDRKMLRNVEKRGVHAARNDPSADGKYWQRLELGIHGLKSWDRNWQRKVRETRNSGGLQGHKGSRPLRSPPSGFPGLSSCHPRVSRRSANQVLSATGLVDDACFPVIRRRLLMAAQGMGAEGTTHFLAPGKRGWLPTSTPHAASRKLGSFSCSNLPCFVLSHNMQTINAKSKLASFWRFSHTAIALPSASLTTGHSSITQGEIDYMRNKSSTRRYTRFRRWESVGCNGKRMQRRFSDSSCSSCPPCGLPQTEGEIDYTGNKLRSNHPQGGTRGSGGGKALDATGSGCRDGSLIPRVPPVPPCGIQAPACVSPTTGRQLGSFCLLDSALIRPKSRFAND